MTSGLPSQSSIRETGPSSAKTDKPDFGWLTDSLRNKVKESQKYSTVARLNGLEGRVVLRITVKENGELLVAIAKSSGHDCWIRKPWSRSNACRLFRFRNRWVARNRSSISRLLTH